MILAYSTLVIVIAFIDDIIIGSRPPPRNIKPVTTSVSALFFFHIFIDSVLSQQAGSIFVPFRAVELVISFQQKLFSEITNYLLCNFLFLVYFSPPPLFVEYSEIVSSAFTQPWSTSLYLHVTHVLYPASLTNDET